MDFNHIYGAGFRHGQVKTAGEVVYDIDAIIGVEGEPEQESTQIPGDDTIKATFSSSRTEQITVTANAISVDVFAAITGNTPEDITVPGTGEGEGPFPDVKVGVEIPLGTQAELNSPFVEVTGVINGKTDEGTNVKVTRVWHKVQFTSVKVNSSNGSEMSVELVGTATQTDKDIAGETISPLRVATLSIEQGSL